MEMFFPRLMSRKWPSQGKQSSKGTFELGHLGVIYLLVCYCFSVKISQCGPSLASGFCQCCYLSLPSGGISVMSCYTPFNTLRFAGRVVSRLWMDWPRATLGESFLSWVWLPTRVILELARLWQQYYKFEVSLDYMARDCAKQQGQQKRSPSSVQTSGNCAQNQDPCFCLPIVLLSARSPEDRLQQRWWTRPLAWCSHVGRGCSLAPREGWQSLQNRVANLTAQTFSLPRISERKPVSWGLLSLFKDCFSQIWKYLNVHNAIGPKSKRKAHLLHIYLIHTAWREYYVIFKWMLLMKQYRFCGISYFCQCLKVPSFRAFQMSHLGLGIRILWQESKKGPWCEHWAFGGAVRFFSPGHHCSFCDIWH